MSNLPEERYFEIERRKAPKLKENGKARINDPDGFQEHLETHPEPWTQHLLEPNDVYELFLQYLTLPGERNMSKLTKRVKEAGYKYSMVWVEEISQLYRWKFRTELYDTYMLKDYEADIKLASRMMKTKRVTIINKLMEIAEEMIDRIDWNNVRPREAVELLKVTISLSQLEFPELNPRLQVNIQNNNKTQIANVSPQMGVANELDDPYSDDAIKSIEDDKKRRDELIRLIRENPSFQHAISSNPDIRAIGTTDDEVYSSAAFGSANEPKTSSLPAPSE